MYLPVITAAVRELISICNEIRTGYSLISWEDFQALRIVFIPEADDTIRTDGCKRTLRVKRESVN